MKLLEKDWNAKGGVRLVQVDYPDVLGQDFINWLRTTSAWHEDVEMVHRRVRLLDRQLAEVRNARAMAEASKAKPADRMAKAREAKRQKRLTAAGG